MPTDRPHLSPTAPALTYLPTPGHFLLRPQTPHAPLNLLKGGVLTTAPGTDRTLVFAPRMRAAERGFMGPKRIPIARCQDTSA
jgi:hypothetical protein